MSTALNQRVLGSSPGGVDDAPRAEKINKPAHSAAGRLRSNATSLTRQAGRRPDILFQFNRFPDLLLLNESVNWATVWRSRTLQIEQPGTTTPVPP